MSGRRRPHPALLGALLLAVAAAQAGCITSSLPRDELPEQPIAFRYRTNEEAERLAQVRERARRTLADRRNPRKSNMINLNQVGEIVGLTADQEERAAAMLGKVALYHPRRGEVEVMEWAPRGTRPLAWSPDHRRLLYIMIRRGKSHVYEYDLDSRQLAAVTVTDRMHLAASYGPDGEIVFSRFTPVDREGRGGIRLFLRDPESGRARPITPGPADSKPVVSPDGRFVIFERRDEDGRASIARVDLEPGAEPRRLATGQDPTLTPDGQWVVYAAPLSGHLMLWRMRPDGSGKQRIGPNLVEETEEDPSVSPDGRWVVFVSSEYDLKRLMVRPLEGGPTWPLTQEGEGLEPIW